MVATQEAPPKAPAVADGSKEQPSAEEEAVAAAPSGRRLLVLLHGEKTNDNMVRAAIGRLRKEGHQVTVRVTYEAGDVDRLVKEALALESADTLVAAGGDGTVQEVVAALLTHTGGLRDTRAVQAPAGAEQEAHAEGHPPALRKLSVGILPMGTSNDFAATTGIPNDPYEALLLATKQDSLKPLDVGLLNGQVFMNTATIGASAEIGKLTSSGLKRILGPAAFLFTSVRAVSKWQPVTSVLHFPNQTPTEPASRTGSLHEAVSEELPPDVQAHVATPDGAPSNPKYNEGKKGEEPAGNLATAPSASKAAAVATGAPVGELEGVPLLHITAANNRQIASMVSISPDALLDDGLLDCVYLTGDAPTHIKRVFWNVLLRGPHRTKVTRALLRVPWLEVATEQPLEWSLDGEPQDNPTKSFRFSLLHQAVMFHLPDDRMLVAGRAPLEAGGEASVTSGTKKRRNPFIPRGKLRAPTLGDMMGRVVRFQKRKDWGNVLGGAVFTVLKTLLSASLGGLVVNWWHKRRDRDPQLRPALEGKKGRGGLQLDLASDEEGSQRGRRGKRHTAIATGAAAAANLAAAREK